MNPKILAAATLGLALGAAAATPDVKKSKRKSKIKTDYAVQCFGINPGPGTGICAVTHKHFAALDELKASDAALYDQITGGITFKVHTHTCAARNQCSAAEGHLEWVGLNKNGKPFASARACAAEGGFTFSRAGTKLIVDIPKSLKRRK